MVKEVKPNGLRGGGKMRREDRCILVMSLWIYVLPERGKGQTIIFKYAII
jgi:hypothetical protein